MPDERFRLEADLLTKVRADGWEAYAYDTKATWKYDRSGSQWFCINRPADARLIPTVSGPDLGKVLRVDPLTAAPSFSNSIRNITPTNSTAIDDASQIEVVTVTIPGGELGPNGYLRCRVFGQFINTSGSSRTLQAGDFSNVPWTHSVTSQNYPTGNAGSLVYACEIWNENSESIQRLLERIDLAKASTPHDAFPAQGPLTGGATDTSADWSYSVGFTMSVANVNLHWNVYKILLETFYSS